MTQWQLQDAKARLSEVVKRANAEGPQIVTLHGKPAAVVVSVSEFERMTKRRRSLVDFLLSGPKWPDDLVEAINDRSRDTGRDITF
jgi:prevent-host-death family protein